MQLLYYWTQCAADNSGEPLCNLKELFWNNFIPECKLILENNPNNLIYLEEFFKALKNPILPIKSKSSGVKFSDSGKSIIAKYKIYEQPVLLNTKSNPCNKEFFENSTASFLSGFVVSCYKEYKKDKNAIVYDCFATLISSFPSNDIFKNLLLLNENVKRNEEITAKHVLQEIILPALDTENKEALHSTITIFVSLYSLLLPNEQKDLLDSMQVNRFFKFVAFSRQNVVHIICYSWYIIYQENETI